ncbi:MAG: hypothetical protein Q9227_002884 [Pyrenula ochraceoflavens]
MHDEYGTIVRTGPTSIMVFDRDTIRKVVIDWDLPKSLLYNQFKIDGDVSTLFTERDKVLYRHKRRLLSPGFGISYLNSMEPMMRQCAEAMLEVMDRACASAPGGKTTIDAYTLLGDLGLDIIGATAFGGSFDLVRNKTHALRSETQKHFKTQNKYRLIPFLRFIPGAKQRRKNPVLQGMLDDILQRRQAMEKSVQRKDLLQIFLDAHREDPKTFTWDNVRAEMLLFLIAGAETASSSLTFTLLLLVNNPQALAKVSQELQTAFPSLDETITKEKVMSLPYLEAVINESLRLMPPAVNGMPRVADRDLELEGYLIPKGTMITAHPYTLQQNPLYFGPDPHLFNPDRWLSSPSQTAEMHKAFLPFSAGSRNCIGKK